mgnify:CR=1 FL=1
MREENALAKCPADRDVRAADREVVHLVGVRRGARDDRRRRIGLQAIATMARDPRRHARRLPRASQRVACGKDADGPTSVEINGLAKITGGTGKYAGASGTLKVDGSFASKHPANGVTEKVDLTLTLSGNIVTK